MMVSLGLIPQNGTKESNNGLSALLPSRLLNENLCSLITWLYFSNKQSTTSLHTYTLRFNGKVALFFLHFSCQPSAGQTTQRVAFVPTASCDDMAGVSNWTVQTETHPGPTTPAPLPIIGPTISNVVCGVNLNCRVDLKVVAMGARNAVYNPKRFPATILRLRSPKATGLVFESGKLQVLGVKNVDDGKLAARKFARMLQKLGMEPRLEDFNVQNIVAHADTRMLIRLEGLNFEHREFAKYEPEIFPGLVYTIHKPKMKVLVFARGKLVLLGAKSKEDLDNAVKLLYPVLLHFRRT